MLKYNKIIVTLSIIVSFGGKFCHAIASTDKLDDAERGFGNSIQFRTKMHYNKNSSMNIIGLSRV